MNKKEKLANHLRQLHTKIVSGAIEPHFATVSGVVSTKTSLIKYVDTEFDSFNLITTKSFQVSPNQGNREPIICEPELASFGNSVGLRNVGLEKALPELRALRKTRALRSFLNISVSASCVEDFITLIRAFDSVADCIELNFSCPHAASGYGASIGCDVAIASTYVKEIRHALPHLDSLLFIKLTPNVDNIGLIAKSVIDAGADGITAINTVGPTAYIEPHSQEVILQNKLGGKGGMSGSWVFERALSCVAEIREAIGEAIPIIGMGGVSNGFQAAQLFCAGADIVGIGSAFGMVHQKNWKAYTTTLQEETKDFLKAIREKKSLKNIKKATDTFLRTQKAMNYVPKKIINRIEQSSDVIILTLEGECDYGAGEFIFLWIPGVGEKPFSLAVSKPLTVIIKKRGPFTSALFDLHIGDTLYMRGLYGEEVETPDTPNALLIAGGTGIAVLPALAKKLKEKNSNIITYVGTSESPEADKKSSIIEEELLKKGSYISVADDGVVARVLTTVSDDLASNNSVLSFVKSSKEKITCYFVGPTVFMSKAASIVQQYGIAPSQIFISLELNTMCGIGLCGECACGSRLSCQYGTFIRYDWYEQASL